MDARMINGGDVLPVGDDDIPGVCGDEEEFPFSIEVETGTEGVATGLTCACGGVMTSVLS